MVRVWRSAGTAVSSTNRPANGTHAAGHDRSVVGDSQKWFGSIHRQRRLNPRQLRWRCLLKKGKGHHLSWQSPGWTAQLSGGIVSCWSHRSTLAGLVFFNSALILRDNASSKATNRRYYIGISAILEIILDGCHSGTIFLIALSDSSTSGPEIVFISSSIMSGERG